jgi:glutaredoxin-related protein
MCEIVFLVIKSHRSRLFHFSLLNHLLHFSTKQGLKKYSDLCTIPPLWRADHISGINIQRNELIYGQNKSTSYKDLP